MELTQSDWIGVVGVGVSLLGFALALYQISKTQAAAESASKSAEIATEGIRRLDTLISFTSVARAIEQIKAACRNDRFDELPSLFDDARKALISAKGNQSTLTDGEHAKIQKALSFFKTMEIEIAKADQEALAAQKVKFTKALIEISDDISALAAKMKTLGEH
jgi:hypothetical protein